MKSITLRVLKQVIEDNVPDVGSLVELLELSIEDIMDKFPEAIMEHKEKFILESEEDYYEEERNEDNIPPWEEI